MFDLEFFLGPLLESTAGHLFSSQEAHKNFGNDLRLFGEKQKRDTNLDVFSLPIARIFENANIFSMKRSRTAPVNLSLSTSEPLHVLTESQ